MYYFEGLQRWVHFVPVTDDSDVENIIDMEARENPRVIQTDCRQWPQIRLDTPEPGRGVGIYETAAYALRGDLFRQSHGFTAQPQTTLNRKSKCNIPSGKNLVLTASRIRTFHNSVSSRAECHGVLPPRVFDCGNRVGQDASQDRLPSRRARSHNDQELPCAVRRRKMTSPAPVGGSFRTRNRALDLCAALSHDFPDFRFGEKPNRGAPGLDKVQVKEALEMIQELTVEDDQARFSEKEVVTALYRSLLGRTPDPAGLDGHIQGMRNNGLVHTFTDFANSLEFRNRVVTTPARGGSHPKTGDGCAGPSLAGGQGQALGPCSPRLEQSRETELYYSVLTAPQFRAEEIQQSDRIENFYATGANDMAYFDAFLQRNGVVVPANAVVAEFGCGVGRVTRLLARRFSKVLAFDVSAPHLKAASERIKAENIKNVEFIALADPSGLNRLRDIDLFFSLIVLQHNPPPIIADILEHACRGLKPDGIALFRRRSMGWVIPSRPKIILKATTRKARWKCISFPNGKYSRFFKGQM